MDSFFITGELQKGDTVLIHAGGSGVGTAAIQLAVLAGAKPIITAGSEAKISTAMKLGAVAGFNYKEGDFSEKVLEYTKGTVKPVLSRHSKIDKTKISMTNGTLMKVKSIAECSPRSRIGEHSAILLTYI